MNIIYDMWRYACAASVPDCRKILPESTIIVPMSNSMDSAHIWEDDNRVVLAFAGTKGTFEDWWQNFQTAPNHDGLHSGFSDAIQNFLPSMADFLRGAKDEGKRIYVTGHSQGGAQACVAAYYLHHLKHISAHHIVSFGAPPFALREDYSVPVITRVICGNDPVECCFLPSRRAEDRIQLEGTPGGAKFPILDHDWASYTHGLMIRASDEKDLDSFYELQKLFECVDHTFTKLEGI